MNKSIDKTQDALQVERALKLALEALESCSTGDWSTGHVIHPSYDEQGVDKAITAIRVALASKSEALMSVPERSSLDGAQSRSDVEQPAPVAEPHKQQEPICKLFGTLPVYDRPAKQQEPEPLTGETNVELGFYSNDASNGQQRKLAGKVEMGQLVGNRAHESASNPDAEREIAVITGVDEYGPMLGWFKHWINYPVGTKLYTSLPAQQEPWVHATTWRGLTDEDLAGCDDEEYKQARYWEQVLREKNT